METCPLCGSKEILRAGGDDGKFFIRFKCLTSCFDGKIENVGGFCRENQIKQFIEVSDKLKVATGNYSVGENKEVYLKLQKARNDYDIMRDKMTISNFSQKL